MERVVMRPPGHSGKAKKGHLCFDAIYETGMACTPTVPSKVYNLSKCNAGNLGRVDFINDYEYDLLIRPDT